MAGKQRSVSSEASTGDWGAGPLQAWAYSLQQGAAPTGILAGKNGEHAVQKRRDGWSCPEKMGALGDEAVQQRRLPRSEVSRAEWSLWELEGRAHDDVGA